MLKSLLGLCAAILLSAAPATATISFNLAGADTASPSMLFVENGFSVTATARTFGYRAGGISELAHLSAAAPNLRLTTDGLGIAGGTFETRVDSYLPFAREAILLAGSEAFHLNGVRLNSMSGRDPLALYGVNGNSLVFLGNYGGAGTATQSLSVDSGPDGFLAYLFAVRDPGPTSAANFPSLSFQLSGLDIAPVNNPVDPGDVAPGGVPEPASWAMLIIGFGLVGAVSRRRRFVAA